MLSIVFLCCLMAVEQMILVELVIFVMVVVVGCVDGCVGVTGI